MTDPIKQNNSTSFENFLDKKVEPIFWHLRHIAMISVIALLVVAITWYLIMAIDLFYFVTEMGHLLLNIKGDGVRETILIHSIEAIDSVLMASIFLVFTFGIYELFISDITAKTNDDSRIRGKILQISSIDELKSKLGKLILMVLIVKLFQAGLTIDLSSQSETGMNDLLKFAGVIVLVAIALFLSHSSIHIDWTNKDKN